MLFLAVFCGFLAEYQLEHKIEKDRERKYMQSMIEDLKTDSAMFTSNIKIRQSRLGMIDSMVTLLSARAWDKKSNDVYFFARSISPPANIFSNDRTIQQLKSSGGLRLIHNKEISNSIMAYDQKIRQVFFEMGDEMEMRTSYRELAPKIFDSKIFYQMMHSETLERPTGNPALFNDSPALINELIGSIQYLKRVHMAQLVRSEQLLEQAKQLMEEIKKVYRLE